MKVNQLLFVAVLFLCAACGNDTTINKQKELLTGRWNLVEGQRNGKVTESLRDTYFEFTGDNSMSTNLPIKGGLNSTYEIEDDLIVQTINNDLTIKYTIDELTPSILKLSTKIRGFDFLFSLEKVTKKEEALSVL